MPTSASLSRKSHAPPRPMTTTKPSAPSPIQSPRILASSFLAIEEHNGMHSANKFHNGVEAFPRRTPLMIASHLLTVMMSIDVIQVRSLGAHARVHAHPDPEKRDDAPHQPHAPPHGPRWRGPSSSPARRTLDRPVLSSGRRPLFASGRADAAALAGPLRGGDRGSSGPAPRGFRRARPRTVARLWLARRPPAGGGGRPGSSVQPRPARAGSGLALAGHPGARAGPRPLRRDRHGGGERAVVGRHARAGGDGRPGRRRRAWPRRPESRRRRGHAPTPGPLSGRHV